MARRGAGRQREKKWSGGEIKKEWIGGPEVEIAAAAASPCPPYYEHRGRATKEWNIYTRKMYIRYAT